MKAQRFFGLFLILALFAGFLRLLLPATHTAATGAMYDIPDDSRKIEIQYTQTVTPTNYLPIIIAENSTQIESPCIHNGSGTDYPVGPGQVYATISDVPWGSLAAGDTVRIFYRLTPYKEKIIISTDGTEQNPIRVCGVPGPSGERPILDGDGATNDPDDSDAYGTYAPMEGLAMILLWNRDYDLKVHNIIIDGLHIRNAKNSFNYTSMDGSSHAYLDGAACIRVQAGDNIVIRNNELENCGNGIFTMSQEYNEASLTRNILIEGNYLHGHGQPGSYLEHGVYVQAIGATYQYNRFGPNAAGAEGVTLKERVAGSVIRYNWFDSGSSRVLDLVEVEDAAPWYLVSEYLAELGCSSVDNCPNIDQDRLQKVQAADAAYRKNYVYGNFFNHIGSQTEAGNIVHYGSDNDEALSHNGTLYFYNNTVSIRQDQDDSWRFRLFYLGNRDATANSQETAEVFNNIIYYAPENTDTPAYFCWDDINAGTFNLGKNWFNADWNNSETLGECYYYGSDPQPIMNGAGNLLDTSESPIPINLTTLAPNDTPLVRGQAQSLPPDLLADHPLTHQYVRHQGFEPRPSMTDLGAEALP